jgi:hypothetical protein
MGQGYSASLYDFAGNRIEDTYGRIVQVAGPDNQLYDGRGNLLTDLEVSGSLTITDTIAASQFVGDGTFITGVTATPAPAGPFTSVQFRDGLQTSGSSDFVFNKQTGGVTAVSFTGSFFGPFSSDNAVLTTITASNANITNLVSENATLSGSFSGSFSGSANFNNLSVTELFANNVTVQGGSLTANLTGSANLVSSIVTGSFKGDYSGSLLGDAILNQATITNTNATGSFTGSFNGVADLEDLIVLSGSIENLVVTGDAQLSNALIVSSNNTRATGSFKGDFSGSLIGDADLNTLDVNGPTTFTGNIQQTGDTQITGSVDILGNQTNVGNFNITGDTQQTGNTQTTGSVDILGNQTNVGDVQVTGNTQNTGSVDILGNQTNVGNLQITGDTQTTGSVDILGNQTNVGNFTITGDTQQTGNTQTTGSVDILGDQTNVGRVDITGNIHQIGNQSVTGSLYVSDTITTDTLIASTYIVSSSVTNLVTKNISGSTVFGDTQDDTHQRTGSLLVTGSQTNVGDFTITGDTTQVGNVTTTGSYFVLGDTTQIGDVDLTGNVTQSGNYTQIGDVDLTGNVRQTGNNVTTGSMTISGSGFTAINETTLIDSDTSITAQTTTIVASASNEIEHDTPLLRPTQDNYTELGTSANRYKRAYVNVVTGSSFTGSFVGNGTFLTDVPTWTNGVLYVSVSGSDATAQRGNITRPWASISQSLQFAQPQDTVVVLPGTYTENPFIIPPNVTVAGEGGIKAVYIKPNSAHPNDPLVDLKNDGAIRMVDIIAPSGSAALKYDSVGNNGIAYDITIQGSGTGSIGLLVDNQSGNPSKLIANEIRYYKGPLSALMQVDGGVLAYDGVHVPGPNTGDITSILRCNGGRIQANNTNVGNPSVGDIFQINGNDTKLLNLNANLSSGKFAYNIKAQPYKISTQNVFIDDSVEASIRVAPGIDGTNSYFHGSGQSFQYSSVQISESAWYDSDYVLAFNDQAVETEATARVHSNFAVGEPSKGRTTGLGTGTPFVNGLKIFSRQTSTGNFVDHTAEATSTSGSTFQFAYTASNDALYIGSDLLNPDNLDKYIHFTGIRYRLQQTSSFVVNTGNYIFEYLTTASVWEPLFGQIVSVGEGHNYGRSFARRNNSYEDAIAAVNTTNWATSSFFGIEARWGRIRIDTELAVPPTFEGIEVLPDSTLVNENGQVSFRGRGLIRQSLTLVGSIYAAAGTVVDSTLAVGSGSDGWNHIFAQSDLNNDGDGVMTQFPLPAGVCTAYPMNLKFYFINTSATNPIIETKTTVLQSAGVLVTDPSGSIAPTPRPITTTGNLTSQPVQVQSQTVTDVTTDKVQVLEFNDFDISNVFEGDMILIRFEKQLSGNNAFTFVGAEVSLMKWALGERGEG